MLTLVSSRPHLSQRKPRKRNDTQASNRMLYRQIQDTRTSGESIQRAIACGRRTIVDTHGSLARATAGRTDGAAPPASNVTAAPPLAARVADIHQRLLLLSSEVERELDQLDVVCDEIAYLAAKRGPTAEP